MNITLTEKNRNNKMIRIYIDDCYSFTIPEEEYLRNGLYEGTEISEEKLEKIRDKVLVRAARERGVRFLTFKDRSEYEVFKKLTEVGFDDDIAKRATQELKTIGYLDDNRFALKYISERMRNKALSKKALGFELVNKGIDKEITEEALAEFEIDDYQIALREAKKRFGKYDLNDRKMEGKAYRFLLHRGFTYEIIKKVVIELKSK